MAVQTHYHLRVDIQNIFCMVNIVTKSYVHVIRLGKVVPNVLEVVKIPAIPKSYHAFVLSMKNPKKNSFTLCVHVNKFMHFFLK